jgi:hypothetical protein
MAGCIDRYQLQTHRAESYHQLIEQKGKKQNKTNGRVSNVIVYGWTGKKR